jgi:peptidoglycan/LPS O-acetylase OafA/YrhL
MDQAADQAAKRFRFLDGLRGFAAVGVLFYHVFIDGLPADALMADRTLWAKAFVLNGTLAVCIFFVVSGFSLSIRYLETGDERGLARIAAGRYLRLAIPIFAICAITYLLMIAAAIPPATARPAPLDAFLTFTPSLDGLLSFSLVKVFVAYSGAETYDPPLWTMSYEFFGSLMVFAILAGMRARKSRTLVFGLLFLALALCQSFYALFVGGILLADLHRHIATWPHAKPAGVALGIGGLALSLVLPPWFGLPYIAVAILLTASVATCAPIRALFENRLSDYLGKISYPLYLVQATVIYAFSLWCLRTLAAFDIGAETQRWIADGATIPVAFICAAAFSPINEFAVKVSRKFGAAAVALMEQPRPRKANAAPSP